MSENNKSKFETLKVIDLVSRGDPIPGIYKACKDTEKGFRIILPKDFSFTNVDVVNDDYIVGHGECVLKASSSVKCVNIDNCQGFEILQKNLEVSKVKKRKILEERRWIEVRIKCTHKPSEHAHSTKFNICLFLETVDKIYPIESIIVTKSKKPRSTTIEEFALKIGADVTHPQFLNLLAYFPEKLVSEAKEAMFKRLFGPENIWENVSYF
jgi:hypothetical protein